MESPPARGFAVAVAVFLMGVVVGRLILERTGTGLVVLAVMAPVVFLVGAAVLGLGRAAWLLALFAATALLIRVVVQGSGWIVLLVVPVLALSAYILAKTVRVMQGRMEKAP